MSRRLILFRSTALPRRLLTVNPNRDVRVQFGRAFRTSMASAQLRPPLRTATKSELFLSLLARFSVTRFASDRRARAQGGLGNFENTSSNQDGSDRQLVTAFEHSPLENVAAGLGAHPGSETVHSGTASVTGLVGSFWHILATLSYPNYSDWQKLVSISEIHESTLWAAGPGGKP